MGTPTTYASALGRLQVSFPSFLGKEQYSQLVQTKDLADVTKFLEGTPYGPEILQSAASYRGAPLLEIACNRTLVRRNRMALDAAPFAGKPMVAAYLRRWDIANIGIILASKALNRPIQESDQFLVSSRDVPAGLVGGPMSLDDVRSVLQQPTVDAVAQALVKFGYGGVLLPLVESYQRTKDIFPLQEALERFYYASLLDSIRYFQGDEWVVREFVRSEIDVKNALLLLKGKDAQLPSDQVLGRVIDGGAVARSALEELYRAASVPELVKLLAERYPTVAEGDAPYAENRSLSGYEASMLRERTRRELARMRAYPLSVGVLFTFLSLAELERSDLRRIVYGKLYTVSPAAIDRLLVVPRL